MVACLQNFKKVFLTLVLLTFFLFLSSNVKAVVNVSACGTLSSANTYYVLNASLSSPGATCITISANNVTLDCVQYGTQYSIYGDLTPGTYGVYINTVNHSIIKNCIVKEFSTGIYIQNAYNTTVHSNNISYNNLGILVTNSYNGTIRDNIKIHGSTDKSIHLKNSVHYFLIKNNTIESWIGGLYIGGTLIESNSDYNTLFNNTITANGSEAVKITFLSRYDNVSYNTITATNNAIGLYNNALDGGTIIQANTINTQNGYGIRSIQSSWSNFTDNTITSSASSLRIEDSSNNRIAGNSFSSSAGNASEFLGVTDLTIGENTFSGNDFGIYFSKYGGTIPSNNVVFDSTVSGTNNDFVFMNGSAYLINVTFDKRKVSVIDDYANYTVKWYVNVLVLNNETGQPVSGAAVNISDVNKSTVFYGLTGSNGYITQQNVTEFFQNSSGVFNKTPHNVTASKSPPNSTIVYVTGNTDVTITIQSPSSASGFGSTNPANVSNLTNTTWSGYSGKGESLAGGNVSNVTLHAASQSWKWAGFYGDVYANLSLKDAAGNVFYYWRVLNVSGAVIAIQNSSPVWDFVGSTPLTGAEVDVVFFASDSNAADNATQTFNETSWGGTVAGKSITSGVANAGFKPFGSGWNVEAINVSNANAANETTGFVANINRGGTLFNGGTGDYELMVPARNPDLTKTWTYYFYIQLGS